MNFFPNWPITIKRSDPTAPATPMEMRTIQIPVTGHPEDRITRQYALYFGKKLGASLLGIHTAVGGRFSSTLESSGEPGIDLFASFEKDCLERGVPCRTAVRAETWEAILKDNSLQADLTIVPFGERFRLPGFRPKDALVPSALPLLLCPDRYIDIESMALAYDGSDASKIALEVAVHLSEKASWPLSVLMVPDDQQQGERWTDDVEIYIDSLPINGTTIILSGTVEKALHRFMKEGSVELLMMGTHGCRMHQPGSIGRIAAYMIEKADFPLLMVP